MGSTSRAEAADLRARLEQVSLTDAHRLGRRLERLTRGRPDAEHAGRWAALIREVERAEAVLARRQGHQLDLTVPEHLPISAHTEQIGAALGEHQVVVVAGETGSGKTTQLPKICLGLGRGARGRIGHTQPRRLAARTVAERLASELGSPLGEAVGFTVRFTDQVSETTAVKLMTDGILLAEIQRDRRLLGYDTIIIDEAHERSLNIDFLLGYLKRLLPRRPDLRVVVTSATIDPDAFARHFGDAPVIEVSGRGFPVQVRYRPLEPVKPATTNAEPATPADATAGPRDMVTGIVEAVEELCHDGPGDVLVFLAGEREIRDASEALTGWASGRREPVEVLPLYARLSVAEQQRVFAPHNGRRVVLATNVAETSLTVPGIHYVVDTGLARISRFSRRTKVQRLPIEPISQASAAQRAGRCGRIAPGVCVRLYAEDDFLARPAFTDPEILRTNLAAVILQMISASLGEVADFPFLDPPDRRAVSDGVQLLVELGAVQTGRPDRGSRPDAGLRLTEPGRALARLPVDPRLGRMLLAGAEAGCLREVLVIVAGLSIQDPREWPVEQREAAAAAHARFGSSGSDFLAYLALWDHLQASQRERSGNQFRRMCRAEFLNYQRVREWQDLSSQLRQLARDLSLGHTSNPEDHEGIHRALLTGLLSQIGLRQGSSRSFQGVRGTTFGVGRGSALSGRLPRWVMAAELVETRGMWARTLAAIEPEWVEAAAGHLVTRSWSEPHWDPGREAVVGYERVSLLGLPLVTGRRGDYARADPVTARAVFLREALVEGGWQPRRRQHRFLAHNAALVAQLRALEERARRRDLYDEEALLAFYDARIGPQVSSARSFDTWWRRVRDTQPRLLHATVDQLGHPGAAAVRLEDFPDHWDLAGTQLPLTYRFAPGEPDDGVSVSMPLALLPTAADAGLDWLVPGLRAELVTALLRGLDKPLRRVLAPVGQTAQRVYAELAAHPVATRQPLAEALSAALRHTSGVDVPAAAFDLNRLPDHLRMRVRVLGPGGVQLASGRDLDGLRARLAGELAGALDAAAAELARTGLRDWDVGDLPEQVELSAGGHRLVGYPALVDEGETAGLRVLPDRTAAEAEHRAGLRRLVLVGLPNPLRSVVSRLDTATKLSLGHAPGGSVPALLADCLNATVDALVAEAGGPVRTEVEFRRLRALVVADLADRLHEVVARTAEVLELAQATRARLDTLRGAEAAACADSVADLRAQLGVLVGPGFLTRTGAGRLGHLRRYLQAALRRAEALPGDVRRDRERMQVVQRANSAYLRVLSRLGPQDPQAAKAEPIRWMIEELRVSLFAQSLGTAHPVSEQRIARAIQALDDPGSG